MKLPGNHRSSLLLGEEKWEKNLDANSWPDTMHLPTPLPSDSSAPVRATPPPAPPPSSPRSRTGRGFPDPILIGASPPAPRLLALGATSFRVHLGDDGPVALCTPSISAEPGHVRGPHQGPACAPGAPAPMPPPGRQPGAPSKTAP